MEGAAPLLERTRELGALDDALTEARAGRGRVVIIETSAGLGKTSLLRAACQTAEEMGFTCSALERRSSSATSPTAACGSRWSPSWPASPPAPMPDGLFEGAAALSRPLFTPTGIERSSRFADRSFSMLHGLYWLLNNLADDEPIALAVDDLHWSDAESLRFLNYLTPRLDGLRLAVLACTRSGARSTELARLAASPEATVLRPAPLSVDATAALCARRAGGERRTGLRRRLPRSDRWEPVLPRGPPPGGRGTAAPDQLRGGRACPAHRPRRSDRGGAPPAFRSLGRGGLTRARRSGAGRRHQPRRGHGDDRAPRRRRSRGGGRVGRPGHLQAGRAPRVRPPDRAGGRARRHRSRELANDHARGARVLDRCGATDGTDRGADRRGRARR